jgi:surface-anchored protein
MLVALAAAGPAAAEVTVEGSGEPAYTNSTNNTQWIRWQQPSGTDAYRLHARYYKNNVQISEVTWSVNTPTGTAWLDWNGVATLEHGGQYGICVTGEFSLPNDSMFFPDGSNSCTNGANEGKRTYTTIDRSKPNASVALAGGAEFTKQGTIPMSIGFQDDVAGPNPANFVCVQAGPGPCSGQHQYWAECSVPGGPGKNTTFSCGVDASELPDGPVTVCVMAADAAVPNNPSSANQTGSASQANLSNSQCDSVVLDRQGPSLAVNASKTVVQTGEQVAFSADLSDSGSGMDTGTSSWEFGDGKPAASGAAASHSFDQPGTYVVKFRAKDKAGNESSAQKTITVEAPASGGTPPASGGTPPAGGGAPPDGGGTPPAGGGPLPGVQIGAIRVTLPKSVRIGRAKQLILGAHTEQPGVLTLRLVRGKKVYSRLTVGLSPGDTKQRLRLPRGLKRGTYVVKIAFKAKGTSYTVAGTAKVAVK